IGDATGCANQLWLGSTSARHFAQDIAAIEITHEQTPPPAPGTSDQANQPNVGITAGSAS
ncbi:MAG: molybdopterin oxidoreductase, partial [Raoultibacter sp.]